MLHCALWLSLLLPQQPTPAAPTVTIEGRVVDLRGEPVPLAQVEVVDADHRDVVLKRGLTESEGVFRIGRVPLCRAWVARVHPEGKCSAERLVTSPPSPCELQVHDAATVRGVLHDRAGKPVAGAIVRWQLIARVGLHSGADAVTDDSGHFTFSSVPLGWIRFAAIVSDAGIADLRQVIQHDAEIVMQPSDLPTTSLTIEVAGVPADALAGCTPFILPYEGGDVRPFPPPWSHSPFDAEGHCVLPGVPDVDYRISVRSKAFFVEPAEIWIQQGAGPHVRRFTATPRPSQPTQAQAMLRAADSKPLAGVALTMRRVNSRDSADATSAADGSLTFECPIAKGTNVLVRSNDPHWTLDQAKDSGPLLHSDRSMLSTHECILDPDSTLQLRAVRACTVRGRLLLPDGRPAAFASVQLEGEQADRLPQWMAYAWCRCDHDGRFELAGLHHHDGAVRVSVEGARGCVISEPFALDAAGSTCDMREMRLSPPAIVEGTVVDAAGEAAPGIRVWLRRWDFAANAQTDYSLVEVITDRLGRYRFVGMPPGGAYLELLADQEDPAGRACEPFEVEAGKTYAKPLRLPN